MKSCERTIWDFFTTEPQRSLRGCFFLNRAIDINLIQQKRLITSHYFQVYFLSLIKSFFIIMFMKKQLLSDLCGSVVKKSQLRKLDVLN